MPKIPVIVATLTLTSASVFAAPPPLPIIPIVISSDDDDEDERAAERTFEKQKGASRRNNYFSARPGNLPDQTIKTSMLRATRQLGLRNDAISAGVASGKESKMPVEPVCVWFCQPSLSLEHSWLTSQDGRPLGSDGDTNMFTGGLSFTTFWDLAVGFNYAFARQELANDFATSSTDLDSHFLSIYAAKSFMEFLYAGVAAGYGHSDIESRVHRPRFLELSHVNTRTITPFIGVNYSRGSFLANLNVAYTYTDSHSSSAADDTDSEDGKVIPSLTLGYAITERLSVSATGKYTQMVHYQDAPPDFPEDRDWWTVGGKITHRVTDHIEFNAAYEYDINDNYANHTVTSGVTWTF